MEIFLKAIDDVALLADWNPSVQSAKAVLLLHQRGRDHGMWDGFRKVLAGKGFSTLAIDLRGHGRSEGFGKGRNIVHDAATDYHSMYFDVTVAMDYLRREIKNGKFAIVGSSIGANLALAYAADHFAVKAAALLSTGLNYYGLRTDDVMIEYHRPLALIAAKDDPYYADSQKLMKLPGVQRPTLWFQEFAAGGHGIKIFEAHPDFMATLADWLDENTN